MPNAKPSPKNTPPKPTGDPDPKTDPKDTSPVPETFSKEQVDEMIASASKKAAEEAASKAREDEKAKLYPTIERHRASENEANEKLKTLETDANDAKAKLKEYEAANLSEGERTNLRLQELEARTKAAEAAAEQQRQVNLQMQEQTKQQQAAFELKLYRERRIGEAGVTIPELVTGETMEAIEASIQNAKAKETAIYDKALEDANKKVRAELGTNVPDTTIPSSSSEPPTNKLTPLDAAKQRSEIANIRDPVEYKKHRAELLKAAHQSLADKQARG